MAVCINCHIILRPSIQMNEYHVMNFSGDFVSIIEEWCGREISDNDQLCQECVDLVIQEANNRYEDPNCISNQQVGHLCVCISCGISLSRRTGRRRHRVPENSLERNYLENLIFPRQIPVEAWACYACWMRSHRNASQPVPLEHVPTAEPAALEVQDYDNEPNESNTESARPSSSVTIPSSETNSWADQVPNRPASTRALDTMHLRHYTRTPDTPNHCFVPDCMNTERQRVPRYIRRSILSQQKIYVTQNARVCQEHSMLFNWNILNEFEFQSSFNAIHLENMLNLLRTTPAACVINFENVDNASDGLCHYWTGLTVAKFLILFNCIPMERFCKKAKTALGMYLVKLRTGESLARMATLFLTSKITVSNYIKKARACLTDFYVPIHLGVGHITREQHSSRNLLIPQGLFGTENNNPIVICDGTYIYLQKSSNYLFQKKSYSLHKFRNLLKPFLMVACDGHIIDVYGPYAATKSDADIIKDIFQDENSNERSYFQQNDIFILDRGFRDAIGLLNSLGFHVHKPEYMEAGEKQLSIIKANKSRCVTLCRWVVEVVNGRFKRDFKLFRGDYFNSASKNLMTDFRVAAAILNSFHPIITDRLDAQAILNRALERFNIPNILASYVTEQNLNRQRASFVSIDGQLPQLDVFPVMDMSDIILFALGVYQIKQARSYYGEHIRENGIFKVEVDSNLHRHSGNTLLLRGRIKSRHQSSKVYYTYILLDLDAEINDWSQRIAQYYCNCIVGMRTVGSCAHIMTIIWYLAWARHQNNILPPARFLDGICVRDDEENEVE